MVSHISSVTSSLAMFSGYPVNGFVRLTESAFSLPQEEASLLAPC
jgi:hypothetical protein